MSNTITVNPTHPDAIQDAIDSASPGTTIWVNDGTYCGFYIGTSDIRILANGSHVIIDGKLPHSASFDLSFTSGTGVYVALTPPSIPTDLGPNKFSFSPSFDFPPPPCPTLPQDIHIEGLHIQNASKSGITIHHCNSANIVGNSICSSASNGIKIINSKNICIISNTIYASIVCGIYAVTSSNLLIRMNSISYSYRGMVLECCIECNILYNGIYPTSCCGLLVSILNSSIIGNKIYCNDPHDTSSAILLTGITESENCSNVWSENTLNDIKIVCISPRL